MWLPILSETSVVKVAHDSSSLQPWSPVFPFLAAEGGTASQPRAWEQLPGMPVTDRA